MSWSTLAPEVKAAWAKMNEWYEEGILDPQFGTRTTDDINAMMINNELGIVFGAWHIPDWRLSSVKALVPEAEYIAYTVADDNGIVHAYHENAAERFLVVSKDCKYPQVAEETGPRHRGNRTGCHRLHQRRRTQRGPSLLHGSPARQQSLHLLLRAHGRHQRRDDP